MQLGFVSAILPDLSLEEVLAFAAEHGFGCVELMCWPVGKAERRYAGVTHVDASNFTKADAERIKGLANKYGVKISGLGYYPNPLAADPAERDTYIEHIRKVIAASAMLGVNVMNTFVGRDPSKTIEDNWPMFEQLWPGIVAFAEQQNVKIGIENCPMLFSLDEWPGGKNLAIAPAVWTALLHDFPTPHLGLNFDPSHLIWQHIDYVRCIHDFGARIFHVHAKDTRIDPDKLYAVGILGLGWHTPKLPGLGDVQWGPFFSALTDAGYQGAVCIEVEDRAFEGPRENRKPRLRQSKRSREQFVS